jgi:SAM-dependent methyltransferase
LGQKPGRGCEIGPGFGYLLFPLAEFLPSISWFAVEHPVRGYAAREIYLNEFKKHNSELAYADITREKLPYPDGYFSVVTFSEVLEHLPIESVAFIMGELSRILEPGGVLIASSPNQASFEMRLRLLQGKSILELPFELEYAPGIFGHIRLYTPSEFAAIGARFGLNSCYHRCESNSSMYRGTSSFSPRRLIHRAFEWMERIFPPLRVMGDTWYMCLVKQPSAIA